VVENNTIPLPREGFELSMREVNIKKHKHQKEKKRREGTADTR
jgi:hypothetical protein